jgi:hypothetical protein
MSGSDGLFSGWLMMIMMMMMMTTMTTTTTTTTRETGYKGECSGPRSP